MPKGRGANHHCCLFGAGYGIPEASRKKGAAWLYLQWALGKENQLRFLTSGAGVPARSSPFGNEQAIAASTFPREFFNTLNESAKIARAGLPEIVPVTQFRDVIGTYQTTRHVEEALYRLTEAYMGLGISHEAQTAAAILGHNYPESQWYKDAYNLLQSGGLQPSVSPGSWLTKLFRRTG